MILGGRDSDVDHRSGVGDAERGRVEDNGNADAVWEEVQAGWEGEGGEGGGRGSCDHEAAAPPNAANANGS